MSSKVKAKVEKHLATVEEMLVPARPQPQLLIA